MQLDQFRVKEFPNIDVFGVEDAFHKTRVCIATEEILGPVRNGGIASTYYHLAKGLAARGHEVEVLLLKGPYVQDETPGHWVEHFAAFGVTLHYLDVAPDDGRGGSAHWRTVYRAAYRWLKEQPAFNVVHTSEWRGGLIYALMAKRMGLAFRETLFVVKTSSPHIWNRHYQMQPITRPEKVGVCYAEQKCVELADVVIGGSAHLITFMEQMGYRLPPANVFAQPNIIDFSEVAVTDERPPRHAGDRVHTRELVFFGRLEARKGLDLFCSALDILQQRGVSPERVTFLGKYGARLAGQGGVAPEDYLAAKAGEWPFPVEIVTDRNQPGALSLMCSRDMIAVMPSLIENSTMAVYETLENRIPFIATAVGGTAELIAAEDHALCLVPPRSTPLADKLEQVLAEGQVIPRASFSNERNLEVWYGFHNRVGRLIAEEGAEAATRRLASGVESAPTPVEGIACVALVREAEGAEAFAEAIVADPPDEVVVVVAHAGLKAAAEGVAERLQQAGVPARLSDCIGQGAGEALSAAVAEVGTDALVVADGLRVRPRPGFFAMCRRALARQETMFVTSFVGGGDGELFMPLGGDVATQFLASDAYGPELIALRRARIEELGPFEPYNVAHGILHEYVTRNVESGGADLLVCPEALLACDDPVDEHERRAGDPLYDYLKMKPLIDAVGLSAKKILLTTLQLSRRTRQVTERRDRLQERVEALQERIESIRSKETLLHERNETHRTRTEAHRARIDELRAQMDPVRQARDEHRDRVRREVKQKEKIRTLLQRSRAETDALRARLSALESSKSYRIGLAIAEAVRRPGLRSIAMPLTVARIGLSRRGPDGAARSPESPGS